MKNQKNYSGLIAVLSVLLVFGFASCGKSDNQTSDTKNTEKKEDVKEVNKTIDSTQIGTIYTCPMHPEVLQNYPGTCPKCKMDLEKKEDQSAKIEGAHYYTCPMHPKVMASYQGKCPLCKMDLEEMHGDNHKH